MTDCDWRPLEDKRKSLGIPEDLRSHTVLHVRTYRGVGDDLLAEGKRKVNRNRWKQVTTILERERKVEKSCVVDLDTESLPDDYIAELQKSFTQDQDRRRQMFLKGRLPIPLTGFGVFFTLAGPLDDRGLPLPPDKRRRSALEADQIVKPIDKQSAVLPTAVLRSVFERPAILQMFVRAGEDDQIRLFQRITAGFDYMEETVPIVRKRLLETLCI